MALTRPGGPLLALFLLAAALAADAAAVSAGLGASGQRRRTLAGAALCFGAFQAGMAGLGAWGGTWLAAWAGAWDHWVAFGLLVAVGGKMVWAAGEADDPQERHDLGIGAVLALAVATSLDALATGVTLPQLGPPVGLSLLVIGGVTAGLSAAAGAIGRGLGARLGPSLERGAGVVLIGIGTRILAEGLALLPLG